MAEEGSTQDTAILTHLPPSLPPSCLPAALSALVRGGAGHLP